MEKLKHLIDCLKPHEIQLAEQYFKLKAQGKSVESKKLKLFKLILSGKAKTDEAIASQLYDKKTCSAYSHLKKRVQEDILNLMLLSSNQQDEEDHIAEEIKCRKLLIQAKMLINRGVIDEGLVMLENLSEKAQSLEFHDIKLAAEDVLRTYSDLRTNRNAVRSYDRNINESFNLMRKIFYAKQMNYEVRHPEGHSDDHSHTYRMPFRPVRQETDLGSERLNYWYNKLALGNSQQLDNFEQAEKYANILLNNIKHNPKLYSKNEVSDLFLEVSTMYFNKRQYRQATKYATGAIEYCKNHEERKYRAMRIIFLSLFRNGEIDQSWKIVNEVLDHSQQAGMVDQKPIWLLQKATLEFTKQDFSDSVKTLQTGFNQLSGKSDWMVGYRLMELLNIMELQDYDWLEYKLEAFRKFVYRLHCTSKDRYTAIHKLFKKCLDLHKDTNQLYECLKYAEISNEYQQWDPMGAEIINIFGWFKQKFSSSKLIV